MNLELPLSSLKELCLIKTAICLWNTNDVVNHMLETCIYPGYYERSKEWEAIPNTAAEMVSRIPVPKEIATQIRLYVDPIGSEIEKWFKEIVILRVRKRLIPSQDNVVQSCGSQDNVVQSCGSRTRGDPNFIRLALSTIRKWCRKSSSYSRDPRLNTMEYPKIRARGTHAGQQLLRFYLKHLPWNCLGVVNVNKMAMMIVNDDRLKVSDRYLVADRFCLVEEAAALGAQCDHVLFTDFDNKWHLFRGREATVKYFWDSLSNEEEQRAFEELQPSCRYLTTETVRFVLSRMSLSQQLDYLERGAYARLLEWPCHNLFLHLTECHKELLSPTMMYKALDFLIDSAGRENNLLHRQVLTSYAPMLPERVFVLYVAVKEAMTMYYSIHHVCLDTFFETTTEECDDYECHLKHAWARLLEFTTAYPYPYEIVARESKVLLRRYVQLSASDTLNDLEGNLRDCLVTFYFTTMPILKKGEPPSTLNRDDDRRCCEQILLSYLELLTR